jgi:hypothetical protein
MPWEEVEEVCVTVAGVEGCDEGRKFGGRDRVVN